MSPSNPTNNQSPDELEQILIRYQARVAAEEIKRLYSDQKPNFEAAEKLFKDEMEAYAHAIRIDTAKKLALAAEGFLPVTHDLVKFMRAYARQEAAELEQPNPETGGTL